MTNGRRWSLVVPSCLIAIGLAACSSSSADDRPAGTGGAGASGAGGSLAANGGSGGGSAGSGAGGGGDGCPSMDGAVGRQVRGIQYNAANACFEQDPASFLEVCVLETSSGTLNYENGCILDQSGTAYVAGFGGGGVTPGAGTNITIQSYSSATGACAAMFATIMTYSGNWSGNPGPVCP
jgi:hypothetical protein